MCFPSTFNRQAYDLQQDGEGYLGSSDASFEVAYARSNAVGDGCAARIGLNATGGPGIGRHVTTANVVADMVEMVEQHGAWREAEAKRLLSQNSPKQDLRRSLSQDTLTETENTILRNTRWHKGSEQLLYWGFSYGTILGATFAAMQPDRVSRLVVDGVAQTSDYYSGRWLLNILEADAIFSRFFDYCYEAGPEKCAFMQEGDSNSDLRTRFDELIANIKKSPVPVPASPDGKFGPDIIKYDHVRGIIFQGLYSPLNYYKLVAEGLADLARGNGTLISMRRSEAFVPFCPSGRCGEQPTPYSPDCQIPGSNDEVSRSIMCSDGDEVDRTLEDLKAIWAKTRAQSDLFGDVWSHIHAGIYIFPATCFFKFDRMRRSTNLFPGCTGWKIRPKWRFTGINYLRISYIVHSTNINLGPFVANTSFPLLWLGNTGDRKSKYSMIISYLKLIYELKHRPMRRYRSY